MREFGSLGVASETSRFRLRRLRFWEQHSAVVKDRAFREGLAQAGEAGGGEVRAGEEQDAERLEAAERLDGAVVKLRVGVQVQRPQPRQRGQLRQPLVRHVAAAGDLQPVQIRTLPDVSQRPIPQRGIVEKRLTLVS